MGLCGYHSLEPPFLVSASGIGNSDESSVELVEKFRVKHATISTVDVST